MLAMVANFAAANLYQALRDEARSFTLLLMIRTTGPIGRAFGRACGEKTIFTGKKTPISQNNPQHAGFGGA